MKTLLVLAAGGALLLAAALPATGQALSTQASGPPIQLAAEGESGAKRNEYLQKSRDEMREWQKKLHNLGDKASTKGQDVDAASKSRLRSAWTATEAASHRLEATGTSGWESAKNSYEKASQNLKGAWHKIHPEDE